MPLGNAWAFPSSRVTHDESLRAMRVLAERIAEGRTGLPAERSRPIPLHAFHPVGIAGHMVGGRLKDLVTPRIRG